jgi:polygalacturonase
MFISHAEDVVIRDNVIKEPRQPLSPAAPNEAAIVIRNCGDVTISGTTFPEGVTEVIR